MSSPTNPPYQSKLFSFLNRQYIKLKDNSIKTWRGLKVAVTWSAQIILYPVYLIVQTGRLLGRQLSQRSKLIQLPSWSNTKGKKKKRTGKPAIEATLTQLESWFPEKIEAIAADKENGKLLLVQQDNLLLDILDEQQQKKLNKIIIENIANYWRQRQEHEQIILAKKFPNVLAPIKTDNKNIMLPIRLFWEIMQWIQYSPVAMSVNLFGEAYLEPIVDQDKYNFFRVQELIVQAIDYFFGANVVSKVKLPTGDNHSIGEREKNDYLNGKSSLSLPQVKTTDQDQNWLTWSDLYYEYVPIIPSQTEIESKEFLEIEAEIVEEDYLETQAISLGYVQHPLEKILKWLDRAVEWLENLCLNIWRVLFKKNNK